MNKNQAQSKLIAEGFTYTTNPDYLIKKIGNGFYINIEWQDGCSDKPLVKATHESQFAPTANNPFNVSYIKKISDHNRIPNTYKNVTFAQRYIRNASGVQSSNRYVCDKAELLENRLSK
jgi:hypothetical protein